MWSGSSGDFFSDSACRLGLTSANRTIARLRPGIAAAVKDRVNDAGVQTSIADALKKYLVVGPGGEIAINGVKDAPAVMTKWPGLRPPYRRLSVNGVGFQSSC
jgi:hypothetical protein